MSSSEDKLYKFVNMWYELDKEIKDKKERLDLIKQKIKELMDKRGLDKLVSHEYTISNVQKSRETVSKRDVPSEEWAKWCKKISYSYLMLRRKGESSRVDLEDKDLSSQT
jgi:hypothetical protein